MSSLITRLKITLGKANADKDGMAAMRTDSEVIVSEGKDIRFERVGSQPETGIILYPGGRCDPRAYAPLARAMAKQGYIFVIPNMPLRLAVMDGNRAEKIMAAHPHIKRWILGGHSMGGVMAAHFTSKHQDKVSGLFFAGSYPASMSTMPEAKLPVIMISGSHDFITRKEEVAAAPNRLPSHTQFVTIEGGDHYQFGCFANAEHSATIDRQEQQRQLISSLSEFFAAIPG